MMTRDGQPSPKQARMMAKVFVIATLLGGLVVFLNVTMRSYSIRMQQAELKNKKATESSQTPTAQPDVAQPNAGATLNPEAATTAKPAEAPQNP